MIQRCLEELAIISLNTEQVDFAVEDINNILREKSSDVIYFILAKKLYGIVSTGDIRKCKGKRVGINREFTYLVNWDYMHARSIFRNNSKVNKLPVVDEEGYLLGDYSRWDDRRRIMRCKAGCLGNLLNVIHHKTIYLVNPNQNKVDMFEYGKVMFQQEAITYSVCDNESIVSFFHEGNIFVFVDEDELRGVKSLYSQLINQYGIELYTLKALADQAIAYSEEKEILDILTKQGIVCYTLSLGDQENSWYQKYRSLQNKRLINPNKNILPSTELAEGFFEELYSDKYFKSISNLPEAMHCIDGVNKLKDVNSKYFNVNGGNRLTVGQPDIYQKTVYFFGPCIMIESFVEDKYTIESLLQEKLNKIGMYRVINCGAYSDKKIDINRILDTNFKEGDIAIIYTFDRTFDGIPNLSLISLGERYQIPVKWTVNTLPHCNHKVNMILAEEIFSMIKPELNMKCQSKEIPSEIIRQMYISQTYIKRYFSGFNCEKHNKIGAIVMNCNPFTKGHRYLIECACQVVDFLIIFVVEEDRSLFSFEERFEMVERGTADLGKVMVVPSGKFILSQTTFPEYFLKIADEDIVRNVEYDITLFADYIASELHIAYRFVGEEPIDNVTNEYNNAMKKILPKKGIHLMEIARKMEDGVYISASEVRTNIERGSMEEAYRLVPETTINILEGGR
jgi:cytidyltransferase-like protein